MVTVRAMTEADAEAVASIRVTGWRTAYAGIVPRSCLDRMTVEADARRHRQRVTQPGDGRADLVAVDTDGHVSGWACLGPCRDADTTAATGELCALYVQPALIGSGIGRTLLGSVHAHARAYGFDQMVLWVLTGNTPARRFYARAGYVADGAVQTDEYDGVCVPELRYRLAADALKRPGGAP